MKTAFQTRTRRFCAFACDTATRRRGDAARIGNPQLQREGSALVVVLALLGALTILGFLMLTVSSQEEVNAQYFADAAKVPNIASLGADEMFNDVLRQVIVGPRRDEYNSALWGGAHSLLATMFGRDPQPFSGGGINLVWDTDRPKVDQDRDGTTDFDDPMVTTDNVQDLILLNHSPMANDKFVDFAPGADFGPNGYPEPDGDYTSPDRNSTFLSFDVNWPDNSGATTHEVRLPSFDRPQYLRNVAAASAWHNDTVATNAMKRRLLRPHIEHHSYPLDWDGMTASTTPRYIIDAADALDPDNNGIDYDAMTNPTEPYVSGPFPFATLDGTTFRQGVWSGDVAAMQQNYILNADTDGDGVNESFYIDVGFPIQQTTGGTEYFVPIPAIRIVDADGLINLNAHGNLEGDTSFTAATWGNDRFLSHSNQGVSPSEVNPQYTFYASPVADDIDFPSTGDLNAALQQHNYFFGRNPAAPAAAPPAPQMPYWELSNMEYWFLLQGRAEYSGGNTVNDVVELHAGRHGELAQLQAGLTDPVATRNSNNFSWAGQTGFDDNNNQNAGGTVTGGGTVGFPAMVTIPPFLQPRDERGSGSIVDPSPADATLNMGRARLLGQLGTTPSAQLFPAYYFYHTHPDIVDQTMAQAGPGYPSALLPSFVPATLVDEEDETDLEPAVVSQENDATFDAGENFGTQGNSNDIASIGYSSRFFQLALFNSQSLRNNEIRQQLTLTNWDLKNFNKPFPGATGVIDARREWEFYQDPNNGNLMTFPPVFGTVPAGDALDPFRPELRELLTVVIDDQQTRRPQRRFSINGVLDRAANGRLRFRPLTPHPAGLGNTPVTSSVTQAESISSPADQEWMARRDRQLMCRDIYVMLYTMCGGNDTKNYTTSNAGGVLYQLAAPTNKNPKWFEDRCRQMAQLAVNWVDRLDPDDTITVFEYDTDLSNGWGDVSTGIAIDDNPFTNPFDAVAPSSEPQTEYGTVYGVESQQLAINEGLFFIAARFLEDDSDPFTAKDHRGTNINDTQSRDVSFVELENVSTHDVNLGLDDTSGSWQIVIKPYNETDEGVDLDGDMTIETFNYVQQERRLTLFGGSGMVVPSPGSTSGQPRFTIGTAGDTHLKDTNGTDPAPTRFQIRPKCGQLDEDPPTVDTPPFWYTVAPTNGLSLDLMKNHLKYRVSDAPATPDTPGDGLTQASDQFEPSGKTWLSFVGKPGPLDENAIMELIASGYTAIRVELRRRMNLSRQSPVEHLSGTVAEHINESRDNPWITVDKATFPIQVFRIPEGAEDTGDGLKIRSKVIEIDSSQRYQPLDGFQLEAAGLSAARLWEAQEKRSITEADVPPATPDRRSNTLGDQNEASEDLFAANSGQSKYTLWQSHFDRDYASAVELFDLPIYGPTELTRALGQGTTRGTPTMSKFDQTAMAGFFFLNPDNPDATVPGTSVSGVDDTDNRWYRLLEFAEVPSRQHRKYENPWYTVDAGTINADPIGFYRVAGKINLNTLRHPAVLAGLLDDPDVMRFDPNANTAADVRLQTLKDEAEPATRDWWVQYLLSREGVDPLNAGWIVPGLPSGRAAEDGRVFRNLAYSARGNSGFDAINDTVLRTLPADALVGTPDKQRRIFELGTNAQHQSGVVDPTIRHRLLQKVMNNTTTRSNVFFIFVQLDYFEAVEVTDPGTGEPVVRIGAKRADSPAYRSFFVVDRSKALELLEPQHLPDWTNTSSATYKTFSFDPSFNYRSLILSRQRIN